MSAWSTGPYDAPAWSGGDAWGKGGGGGGWGKGDGGWSGGGGDDWGKGKGADWGKGGPGGPGGPGMNPWGGPADDWGGKGGGKGWDDSGKGGKAIFSSSWDQGWDKGKGKDGKDFKGPQPMQPPPAPPANDKASLVGRVKAFQRTGDIQRWYEFVGNHTGTTHYDPNMHNEETLMIFLSQVENQPPAKGGPPQGPGDAWPSQDQGKGKGPVYVPPTNLQFQPLQVAPPPRMQAPQMQAPPALGATGMPNLPGMPPGDWLCSKCGDHQFARNTRCRKCGAQRPDMISEPTPGAGSRDLSEVGDQVFCVNMPRAADEDAIRDHFSQFGDVKEVILKKDGNGNSRGLAFITFMSKDSAKQCLEQADSNVFMETWLQCRPAGTGGVSDSVVSPDVGAGGPGAPKGWISLPGGNPKGFKDKGGGKNAKGQLKGPGKSGDWVCTACGNLNFAWRDACHLCNTSWWDCQIAAIQGYGPGDDWAGVIGAQGLKVTEKVWIGNIPLHASEAGLRAYFSQYGEVQEVILKTDKFTGEFRGFGFVVFSNIEAAKSVLDSYDYNYYEGQWIECRAAEPDFGKGKGGGKGQHEITEKIFVASMPKDTSREAVQSHFSQYGPVTEVFLPKQDDGTLRGIGFITFESRESAKKVLDNYYNNYMDGRWLDCSVAVEKDGFDLHFMNKRKREPVGPEVVYVMCLPNTTDNAVSEFFSQFGPVKKVSMEFDNGNFKGSAWIHFEDAYAAQAVLSNYQEGFFQALSFEGNFLDCKSGAEAEKKQRIEGPIGPKIFVGSLPESTNEEEVAGYYSQFGPIKEVVLKRGADGRMRGFGFITFKNSESAKKAIEEATLGEPTPARDSVKPWEAEKDQERAQAAAPTDVYLKVAGMPLDPKKRDVFKLFINFSIARIRECEDNGMGEPYAIVQFTSKGECEKAFQEKQGGKMSTHRVILSDATETEFRALERFPEPPPGTYAFEKKQIATLTAAAAESHNPRPGAAAAWDSAWAQASKPPAGSEPRAPASWVLQAGGPEAPEKLAEQEKKMRQESQKASGWQPSYLAAAEEEPKPRRGPDTGSTGFISAAQQTGRGSYYSGGSSGGSSGYYDRDRDRDRR